MSASPAPELTDFFVTGGTLRPDAPSYVPRQADEDLYAALSTGEFCYVLTSRQLGKSSLMVRTAMRLRQDDVAVAMLDLTALGQNTQPEQWYAGLLSHIGQRLDLEDELEDFWDENEGMGPLHRWVEAIRSAVLAERDTPVVIFIDEIDVVRSLGFSTDEFFAAIRECHNRRASEPEMHRLTFCLVGVATPTDLIQNPDLTPFNIGTRIELADLTEEDAAPLAQGLGGGGETGRRLLKRVFHWTNGHPYLTQKLCAAVAGDATAKSDADVDRICDGLFLSDRARDTDDNLAHVRERLLRSDVDRAALLDTYAQIFTGKQVRFDDGDRVITVLALSGVTSRQNGHLRLRNRIYRRAFDRRWIRENMPDAEVRRQRAAFRRGILQATAIGGIVAAALAVLAYVAVDQAGRARELAIDAEVDRSLLLLKAGDGAGLAHLLRARDLTRPSSPARANIELLWSGWYPTYSDRLVDVIDTGPASAMALTPDGGLAAVGKYGGSIRLIDLRTSKTLGVVESQQSTVLDLAFSPDASILAACYLGLSPRLWDVSTLELIGSLEYPTAIQSIAFDPAGGRVVTGTNDRQNAAVLWDIAARQITGRLAHNGWVDTVRFSPDGSYLATASGNISIWDMRGDGADDSSPSLLRRFNHHGGPVSMPNDVAFDPTGRVIATAGADHFVSIRDIVTGEETDESTAYSAAVKHIAFSPDGLSLAVGLGDGTVHTRRLGDHADIGPPLPHASSLAGVAFSEDGTRLFTASRDGVMNVWTAPAAREPLTTFRPGGMLWDVEFDPTGQRVAAAGWYPNAAYIWDATTGEQVCPPLEHSIGAMEVAFHPTGDRIATAGADVHIWNPVTGDRIATIPSQNGRARNVAYSPDGNLLAAGFEDGTVRVWRADSLDTEIWRLRHEFTIFGLDFSAGSEFLAASSVDAVSISDAQTGSLIWSPPQGGDPSFNVSFSPDSRLLATASYDTKARVWSLEDRGLAREPLQHSARVFGVAYSADGVFLASGAADGTVQLWVAETGLPYGPPYGHDANAVDVAFSPDGTRLASASWDGTARIWATPDPRVSDMDTKTWAALGARLDDEGHMQTIPAAEWRELHERQGGAARDANE